MEEIIRIMVTILINKRLNHRDSTLLRDILRRDCFRLSKISLHPGSNRSPFSFWFIIRPRPHTCLQTQVKRSTDHSQQRDSITRCRFIKLWFLRNFLQRTEFTEVQFKEGFLFFVVKSVKRYNLLVNHSFVSLWKGFLIQRIIFLVLMKKFQSWLLKELLWDAQRN